MPAETAVKCVVWDLDGTIWRDVAVELPPGARPRVLPEALRAVRLLAGRGILNSLASRTDPAVAGLVEAEPDLAGRFVAPQLGWGHKSDAIGRVAGELGIDPAAVAFVDDDPFERAEVAAMRPEVLVLSPAQLYERLETPRFHPPVVTADGRARAERYRQELRRRSAEAEAGAAAGTAAGDRAEFLRGCRMRLAVGAAGAGDLDRLAELVARTHRFNSTGETWSRQRLAALATDPGWFVPVARLADRFGDYGLIGAGLLERAGSGRAGSGGDAASRLHLFTVSCRAVGRGAPAGFLRWILARARAEGADRLLMDVRPHAANLELRVLLRGSGFQAAPERPGLLERRLDDLPAPVPWLTVTEASAP
jgi:FkbH-like protein